MNGAGGSFWDRIMAQRGGMAGGAPGGNPMLGGAGRSTGMRPAGGQMPGGMPGMMPRQMQMPPRPMPGGAPPGGGFGQAGGQAQMQGGSPRPPGMSMPFGMMPQRPGGGFQAMGGGMQPGAPRALPAMSAAGMLSDERSKKESQLTSLTDRMAAMSGGGQLDADERSGILATGLGPRRMVR